MDNLSTRLLQVVSQLQKNDGKPELLVKQLEEVFKEYLRYSNQSVYKGIQNIENRIHETRKEIAASEADASVVNDATQELATVIKSTEDATNTILDAAEKIQAHMMACADKALANQVIADVTVIFEACNFQDLTGQRIKKVTSTLEFIEESVGGLLQAYASGTGQRGKKDTRKDADLMSGPQAEQNAPNQDDIDRLFDTA